jgi:hypothetical protein
MQINDVTRYETEGRIAVVTVDSPPVNALSNAVRQCIAHGIEMALADSASGAIVLTGAQNCVIEKCTLSHVGTYGIDLATACRDNRIEGCEFTDLGAGGVKIGTGWRRSGQGNQLEDPDVATRGNIVRDCLIAHGGRLHPAAIGVWIGHSGYNTVEHNDIFDFYYTGISVGWVWGYAPSVAHHNTIAYNHIHHFGQGVLSDMGGIYTLGFAEGTVLHHNLIHDVDAFDYGGWGIYFDEGTTHILAENNIVYNTKTGGFHQHYGRENVIENNIFAFDQSNMIARTRNEEHITLFFQRNIVLIDHGDFFGGNWEGHTFSVNQNLYWDVRKKPKGMGPGTIAQWRKRGHDTTSIFADPRFVAPERGDFRLKPGSPAELIGFQPIDLFTVGPREG